MRERYVVDLNNKEINQEQKTNKDVNPEVGKKYSDYITIEREKIPVNVLQVSYPLSKIANILLWIGEAIIVLINIEWLQLWAADIKYFAGIHHNDCCKI